VTKIITLLGVLRGTVSKVMSAEKEYGKTASVKRNTGRESTLTERDRHTLSIVSKSHSTTAAQVIGELNIHLEHPFFTKTGMSFVNPTSTVGLQLLII
jgi:hypothetical protein